MHYLIIGGGVAGTTAAEELRKHDPSSEITLVSEEQHAMYSRVLLPHYIKGKISRERVFLKKEPWYAEQNIEWLRGIFVTEMNAQNKFVRLSDGREMEYDKLLIATGGEVRVLPEEPRGVSYLRTLDDADHLLQLLNERNTSTRASIYGGGFIACEYLNIFAHVGLPTEITFRGKYFWTNVLLEEAGQLINQHLTKQGVLVCPQEIWSHTRSNHQLTGFVTDKQEHSCHVLGVGIGVEPDMAWLKDTGMEMKYGIRTNEFLETSIQDVYAAGDVAETFDVITGRHVCAKNWMNAMTQGRIVAANMMGNKTVFELVSSYAINVLGLEIIFVGDVSKEHTEKIEIIGSIEEEGITQLFYRNGRLVGGAMIGRNQDRAEITRAIKERGTIDISTKIG